MALLHARAAGLRTKDAATRLLHDGPNELAPPPAPPMPRLFVSQFDSPLIQLRIAAVAISLKFGHHNDARFIGVVLLVTPAIGTAQETKAAAALP